jgi:hypothetical protein
MAMVGHGDLTQKKAANCDGWTVEQAMTGERGHRLMAKNQDLFV